ncbi:MAG: alpha/beta fold hydrolase [Pseudomonadota bacterium]
MSLTIENCLGNSGYYYAQAGEEAVLLIHGLTGTPAEMKPIATRLAKQGFSVMCPALAGHCGSVANLKKSRWQDWYGGIRESFDALREKHARVYVSGLSMGALMALLLAKEKGDLVSGLCLLSTTFFYDGWNIPHIKRKLLLPLVLHSPLKYFMYWNETSPYGIKCERTRAMVHAVLQKRDSKAAEKVGIFRTPAVTIFESNRLINVAKKALCQVKSPTLIVHSTEDDTASMNNAHYVAKRIASKKIEKYFVDDTYHVLTLDKRRADVANRMAGFFKQCTANPA